MNVNDPWMNVLTGVLVPCATILISTLVAIWLARAERQSAAAARREERADLAFQRTIEALATLNTLDLRGEDIGQPMRSLRVGLALLASCKDDEGQSVACWFDAERRLGVFLLDGSHRRAIGLRLGADMEESAKAIVEAGEPFYRWVEAFAGNLRLWHKKGSEAKKLKELTRHAETLLKSLKGDANAG